MNNDELLLSIDRIRAMMIDVATGGRPINDVNDGYRALYARVAASLGRKGIPNTLPYGDLWEWYGRWKNGDMPTYQSRREFVNRFIEPLLSVIRTGHAEPYLPTGWTRVDRVAGELRGNWLASPCLPRPKSSSRLRLIRNRAKCSFRPSAVRQWVRSGTTSNRRRGSTK